MSPGLIGDNLRYVVVFLVLLPVIVDECTAHAEIGYNRWMLLLFRVVKM